MKSKTKTIAATSFLFSNTISNIKAQETQQNEPTSKKILAKAVKTSSYQRSSKNDNNRSDKHHTKTSSSTPPSPPFSSSSPSFFSWIQDENATYLDVFGEVAKDILTNQIIPETTASCDWNWMHLRCEPFCHCSYQPLWGDYHLGRSCRVRRGRVEDEEEDAWDRSEGGDDGKSNDWNQEVFLQTCQNPPNTMVYKGMKGVGNGLEFVWNKINWRVRVESARNQMCDSLFQAGVVAGASTTSRERGQGTGEVGDDDDDDDNDELNSGDPSRHYLLEKPVRALRKSLHCHYKSRNSVLVSNLQRKETSHVPENLSDTSSANGMDSGKKVVVVKEEEDAVVDTFTTTLLKTDALSSTTKI